MFFVLRLFLKYVSDLILRKAIKGKKKIYYKVFFVFKCYLCILFYFDNIGGNIRNGFFFFIVLYLKIWFFGG